MKRRAVAIGTFDGVHLGHQRLLGALVREAQARGLEPFVALFPYSPRLFFSGKTSVVKLLTTVEERCELLRRLFGIRCVEALSVSKDFFSISASVFLKRILRQKWNAKLLVMGANFGLGKDRVFHAANAREMAAQAGLDIRIVPILRRISAVSSTRIRGALAEGDLGLARRLLGRPYEIQGKVIRGTGIASSRLGFPTANLEVDPVKLLPRGVFRAKIKELDKWAAVNIGSRPTLVRSNAPASAHFLTVEAHILGFKGSLYGRRLTLQLHEKLRSERKFSSLEALRLQVEKDIQKAARKLI